ncbi:hypothetical protein ABKV19_024738 [Rosa sericea]
MRTLWLIVWIKVFHTTNENMEVLGERDKIVAYQFSNDSERFRYARDTSFRKSHLNFWSQSSVFLCIVCFFRQLL